MMSQPKVVLDGLFYCLRPSLRLNYTKYRNKGLLARRRLRHLYFPSGSHTTCLLQQQRCNSSTARTNEEQNEGDGAPSGNTGGSGEAPVHEQSPPADNGPEKFTRAKDIIIHPPEEPEGIASTPDVPQELKSKSTQEQEVKLEKIAQDRPNVQNAMQILRLLIRDRGLRPEARHYKWLIQCNSDPERGSSDVLRGLLTEMEEHGIPLDSSMLHAVLQAVAVHPDHMLRQDVLRALRDRWLPLSPDGWHYVVAGLIREHQFELALDHIAHMQMKDIFVKDWLHSLLIYYLCEFREFEHVLQLTRSRLNQGHRLTRRLCTEVLTAAIKAGHHETVSFIWWRMVNLEYMKLPPDLLTRTLQVAAPRGDTQLATSIMQYMYNNLEMRKRLDQRHYRHWYRAYLKNGDVYSAFQVVCQMHKAGHGAYDRIADDLSIACLKAKISAKELWRMLQQLKSKGHDVPLTCAKVAIELCTKCPPVYGEPEVDTGIELYKELHTICSERPGIRFFNSLLRMCRAESPAQGSADVSMRLQRTMFVLKEMEAANASPDMPTYRHLIQLCLSTGKYKTAYLYYQNLLERGLRPSKRLCRGIRFFCARSSNEYAVKLLHELEALGSKHST